MVTQCKPIRHQFQRLGRRRVEGAFDGGRITSDGGGLLLSEVDARFDILSRVADCFTDHRNPDLIEHDKLELVAQRIYALALGYEDLVDHDDLRCDPLLATLVGKTDPSGRSRRRQRDRGKALAGKSTLNRLELTAADATAEERYKKIVAHPERIDNLLVDWFVEMQPTPPERIVLDLDATDDPLHGHQEGRFFHGYYDEYCYLPLYVFCGQFPLCARLRQANGDAAAGAVDELAWIVPRIRRAWPDVEIVIRADSGFCREEIMAWCEDNEVDYILGLAKNDRLKVEIEPELQQARAKHERSGQPERVFKDFRYRTLESWSRTRRAVGKAEVLAKGSNPRFVVTSIACGRIDAQRIYEQEYCARGDMENRIKEQQRYLFADRTSTATMRANQLRLYFSTIAYVLLMALRVFGLAGTEMEHAQCHTIREKLLKIGAQVILSVRRVLVRMASGYPYEHLFQVALHNLRQWRPMRC